jgi:hypothetical protein
MILGFRILITPSRQCDAKKIHGRGGDDDDGVVVDDDNESNAGLVAWCWLLPGYCWVG